MNRPVVDRQPLFDAWLPWMESPEPVRQQAVDLLANIYLNTLESSCEEADADDASHD